MGIKDLFKRKNDVVDLSDLQKRGIYKPKLPEKDKEEVIDLSNKQPEEASPLGFLGAMANSSETASPEEPTSVVLDSGKKQRLKGILRDLKISSSQTGDKVYKLSERLDLLEKKLERIERRVGL
jgi:hypothetical protein